MIEETFLKSTGELRLVSRDKNFSFKKITGRLYLKDYTSNSAYIAIVYVNEGYERKGYGTELVNRAIEIAKTNKCKSISLHTHINNDVAYQFYVSLGFFISLETGKGKNKYYLMSLKL